MKEALEHMERKVRELEMRKGTIATRIQQAKAGGGAEGLGKLGSGPSAFDEFQRMEDKIEHSEHTVLAQNEVNAALEARTAGAMPPAEVEAKFRALESGSAPGAAMPAKNAVEDELQALKKKIRIGP